MIRDVEIAALSPRAELLAVVRVGLVVVMAVGLYLGAQARAARETGGSAAGRNLLPYQSLIQGHTAVEQQMFRMLQVALLEAQNLRAANGTWPEVAMMTEQGIEPFVRDPTNRVAQYAWRLLRNGPSVHYLGLPDRPGAPAWLMVLQEPDPAMPPEPYQNDEEHARLLDGTLLHVSIWRHASGAQVIGAPLRLPQAEGWTQVFAVGPSASH
jgi:hypothetical protein